MPYTVDYSFDLFRQAIEPPPYDKDTAIARRERLTSLLKQKLEILDAFPSGSLPKFTAIKDHADLDIIVVLHYGKHIKDRKPSEVLLTVQEVLSEYRTGVRRNGQAVTLYYKTWPNVDVVPVSKTTDSAGNVTHYNIPDMNSETWIQSHPQIHSNELSTRNSSFGDQFKRIIKMIKWWNVNHSDLLQSYHIEVMALDILTGKFSNYPWDLYQFFEKAKDLTASSLWHGLGFVDDYLDYEKRREVVKRLTTASEIASDAWYLGLNEDEKGAISKWQQLFGDAFPEYG